MDSLPIIGTWPPSAPHRDPEPPRAVRDAGKRPGSEWVYAYYDRENEPLYVGIAYDAAKRATQHRSTAQWWRFVASAEATCVPRGEAEANERFLIAIKEPLFNTTFADLYTRMHAIEYCAQRDAWDLVDLLIHTTPHDKLAHFKFAPCPQRAWVDRPYPAGLTPADPSYRPHPTPVRNCAMSRPSRR